MHIGDFIILGVLALLVALAVRHMLRSKGDCSGCGGCGGCPHAGGCDKQVEEAVEQDDAE